jgi:hypothetical protein
MLDAGAIGSKVGTLTKSSMQLILVLLAASSALFAQTVGTSPAQPQNHASVLDAHQIAELSLAATERSWKARAQYTYMERDEDRRLDSLGQVKSANVEVTKMAFVKGARFEQLVEHNGHPPSAEEQRRSEEDLDKLKHETGEEQTVRLRKDEEDRSFLRDVLDAFDFQLIGEEMAGGRPAYVLQARPHPGYHAHGKYGKMFSKVEGKLWVDKEDFGWIKVDGQVTQSFSMGLFVARVQRGSHILLEETNVGDGVWVPRHLEVRASARIFFLKSLDVDRVLTYSDYERVTGGPYSVAK